jgi:hypothetical protein
VRVDSAKHIAKSKGVLGDEESKGSWRQTSGLTNRNHIRHKYVGKGCTTNRSPKLSGTYGVNGADKWKERLRSYLGRSHGRAETEYEARLKQDLS